jgi:hypothetical protein
MQPIEPAAFEGSRPVVIEVKDQPQYTPLPASVDNCGLVMTEWELTTEELHRVMCGGRIRLWTNTFGQPFQPIAIEVIEPDCGMRDS